MTSDIFSLEEGRLTARFGGELLTIEPWGRNAVRVRATPRATVQAPPIDALLPPAEATPAPEIRVERFRASLRQGDLTVTLTTEARWGGTPPLDLHLRATHADGRLLLEEARPHFTGPAPRHLRSNGPGAWRCEQSFAAQPGERFYGLGQRQHGRLDHKGGVYDLIQKNAHVSIPALLSSRNYLFVWNAAASGRVELGETLTRWVADASQGIDYLLAVGDTPADLLRALADATGHAPAFPDWALGFWQSRLRYASQAEVLEIAERFVAEDIPLACLVIDFFHWTRQGEWRFDPAAWPDPAAMVARLNELGVRTMVSVWPTVSPAAETMRTLRQGGMLVQAERGPPALMPFLDTDPAGPHIVSYIDPTNPRARDFLWERIREGYLRHGIEAFWIDACEPEVAPADMDHLRYAAGNGAEVGLAYPERHQAGFAAGLARDGTPGEGMLLCRSAWLGSQRHGCLLWSGDVSSSWEALRAQVPAGLSAGLAGLGWWTSDIGGFYGGHPRDPAFHELLIRWFQFGVFCPVTRLHGFRVPLEVPPPEPGRLAQYGTNPGALFVAGGGPNEPWSYGPEIERVLRDLIALRVRLRPYLAAAFARFAADGVPPMRPLFVDFPDEAGAWAVEDQYLLGPDLVVAPVTAPGVTQRPVWLPAGAGWVDAWTGADCRGIVTAPAPRDRIPVYVRAGAEVAAAFRA